MAAASTGLGTGTNNIWDLQACRAPPLFLYLESIKRDETLFYQNPPSTPLQHSNLYNRYCRMGYRSPLRTALGAPLTARRRTWRKYNKEDPRQPIATQAKHTRLETAPAHLFAEKDVGRLT